MKVLRKTRRRLGSRRSVSGFYMIECLVALIIATLFAFALLNMLSETLRLTSSNRKNQAADFMTQSTLDSLKRTTTATWQGWPYGTYVLIDKGEPVPAPITMVGPNMTAINPAWSTRSKNNKFTGQVILDLRAGTVTPAKVAVVTVIFDDSSNSRKISTVTSLHSCGVNFWPL